MAEGPGAGQAREAFWRGGFPRLVAGLACLCLLSIPATQDFFVSASSTCVVSRVVCVVL